MTTDEAIAAVKKAARMAQWMDGVKHACGNPLSVAEWETLQIALRAIAPGGPLVVVPREQLIRAVDAICSHECGHYDDPYRHTPVCSDCRAMIAEGEKS